MPVYGEKLTRLFKFLEKKIGETRQILLDPRKSYLKNYEEMCFT